MPMKFANSSLKSNASAKGSHCVIDINICQIDVLSNIFTCTMKLNFLKEISHSHSH